MAAATGSLSHSNSSSIDSKATPVEPLDDSCQPRWRTQVDSLYTRYILELVLRQKALPPSKDGRHIPLRLDGKPLVDERVGSPYISNSIRSSRYTVWDFLPKQFFFQATRLNNMYFIAIGIPQAIPGISTTGNYTTILPLLFFICLTVAKEGYDDYRRHRLDKVENNSTACVIRPKDRKDAVMGWLESLSCTLFRHSGRTKLPDEQTAGQQETDLDAVCEWAQIKWHDIRVGDIVRLRRNDPVPADIALLSASNENGVAYVETMALDGETSLKSKQAPTAFRNCDTIAGIRNTHAEFVMEDPNRDLYEFNGRAAMGDGEKSVPLTLSEVVYRGSVLRNTATATGIVVNTGEECKIRMNANHHPKAKKPRLERSSNQIVIMLIIYVVVLSIGSSMGYLIWHQAYEINAWYLVNPLYNMFVDYKDLLIGLLIMFNNVIPLALYISLEIVKIGQMLMLQGDAEMYDEASNTPMTCNTNTILENLGQVSYVLSDKTGTLTENVMKFRKMSIAGIACSHGLSTRPTAGPEGGHVNAGPSLGVGSASESHGHHEQVRGSVPTSPRSLDPAHHEPTSPMSMTHARRPVLSNRLSSGFRRIEEAHHELTSAQVLDHMRLSPNSAFSHTARDFILGMALCHTALPEAGEDGQIDFQAPSPDEVALVRAAHELGYTLKARTSHHVTLLHTDPSGQQTELCYEILDVIDFSSKRKRMSIILRCPDGKIWLLCKGADTVIMPRLQQASLAVRKSQDVRRSRQLERQAKRNSDLIEARDSFNATRLGSLSTRNSIDVRPSVIRALAGSRLSKDESRAPMPSLDAALRSPGLEGPSDAEVIDDALVFSRCFRQMDEFATEGLRTLLFAQKMMPATEYNEWMQEHDEAKTALLNRQEKIEAAAEKIEHGLDLLGASAIEDKLQKGVPETIEKLQRANIKIWMLTGDKRETAVKIAHAARICQPLSKVFTLDSTKGRLANQMQDISLDVSAEPLHCVVVIDGQTLGIIEDDAALKQLFYSLITLLDSVICCRASPSQKAGIVKAIRKSIPDALTLAIGDGSNDIAMIQASHVGIGVSGKEGLQAARVADFSIAQFRFLQRLLLVHGRWNYVRTAKFILWTFFKEFFFYMMQALYQQYDGYTGSSLYESWSLTVLNTLFTSLCVIVPGILEQDLSASTLLAIPELYMYGPRNQGLNIPKYLGWTAVAAAEGIIVWFVVWAAWGRFNYTSDNGTFALGDLCFSLGIVWQNIKLLLLETHYKTLIVYGAFGITFAGWWAWNAFLSAIYSNNISPFDVKGGFVHGFGADADWWATFFLALAVLVVLEVAYKAGKRYICRTLVARRWCDGDSASERPASSERRAESVQQKGQRRGVASWILWLVPKWEWMGTEWDVGMWQEIEAEPGVRERLEALARGVNDEGHEADGEAAAVGYTGGLDAVADDQEADQPH